jgi:hypothetical protein
MLPAALRLITIDPLVASSVIPSTPVLLEKVDLAAIVFAPDAIWGHRADPSAQRLVLGAHR